MRELKIKTTEPNPEDTVQIYLLDGKQVHGVRWSGQNLQHVKVIIGYTNEGLRNGKLWAFGQSVEVGDFLYTTASADIIGFQAWRRDEPVLLDANQVFIIRDGQYVILKEG